MLRGARRYVGESAAELRKVAWPTRETVIRLTAIVVAVSIVVGVYLYFIDAVFRIPMQQILGT